ncbi:MAG TPA: hypothetical protein VFS00_21990, partial [Polyangiaceae bacterium]|nr:hypothetical protein [Polyangiaceae bacterium]
AREIAEAKIVILLVTTNFLTSELALDAEVPRLLENRRRQGGRIIPLICRPCAWKSVPWLERLPAWPPGGEPLWPREDANPAPQLARFAQQLVEFVGEATLTGTTGAAVYMAAVAQIRHALAQHESLDVAGLTELLRTGIAVGTPLYNRGERAACATAYAVLAEELSGRLDALRREMPPSRPPAPSIDYSNLEELPPSIAAPRTSAEALAALRPAAATLLLEAARIELWAARGFATEGDDDARAWALRRCFDRLLLLGKMAEECATLPALARLPDLSGIKQFARSTLALMDEIAVQTGVESDDDFAPGALSCAAAGLLGVQALHRILLRLRGKRLGSDNARLRGSLSLVVADDLAGIDPCLVAWQCRCYLQRLAAFTV